MNSRSELHVDDLQRRQRLACRQKQLPGLIRLLIALAVKCNRCKQLLPLLRVRHELLDGTTGAEGPSSAQQGTYRKQANTCSAVGQLQLLNGSWPPSA
jgi:hypothetical protein